MRINSGSRKSVEQAVADYMAANPPGRGVKGDKGDAGATGPAGPQGEQGLPGAVGPTGLQGITGPKGDKGDTGSTGSQGIQGAQGNTGPSGSTFIGNITVAETAVIAITAGFRTVTVALTGVGSSDKLIAVPTTALAAGYATHDAWPNAANQVSVRLSVPLIALGGTYSMTLAVYRLA